MQDTENLKRKQKELRATIKTLEILQDGSEEGIYRLSWHKEELRWVTERINTRKKNRLKNEKQFKKAN